MREGPDDKGRCWPQCTFFKCGNRALRAEGSTVKCLWTNDICIGSSCSYALCIRGKMLAGNRCGLTVKRVTADSVRPDEFDLDKKLKVKLSKRIKDVDDLY
ncbi:MAG: hypothetical protein HYY22_03585 [Thaumarchaeota archaeon]|nr:hypothetical protein [Nitrososphaerota archaeon]